MALPNGASPNWLGANFNFIHAEVLKQQNAAAATAATQPGNNKALQNQGNEFILAAVSSTINLPGFGFGQLLPPFPVCRHPKVTQRY